MGSEANLTLFSPNFPHLSSASNWTPADVIRGLKPGFEPVHALI